MREIIMNLDDRDRYLTYQEGVRQGENLGSEIVVNLNKEFTGYKYMMMFQVNDNTPIATAELAAKDGQVRYAIPNSMTVEPGNLKLVFQAYENISGNKRVIRSAITTLKISESLDGKATIMPEQYVPWYTKAAEAAAEAKKEATRAETEAKKAEESATKTENELKLHNIDNGAHMDIRERVAVLGGNINSLQNIMANVNIGHDAKQGVSGYSEVRLPKNAASGNMDVVVRGRTVTNLLGKDGDFSYGNKWAGSGATLSVSGNILKIKNNAARAEYFYCYGSKTSILLEKPSTYYLIHADVWIENAENLTVLRIAPNRNDVFYDVTTVKELHANVEMLKMWQSIGTTFKTLPEITEAVFLIMGRTSGTSTNTEIHTREITVTEISEDEYNNMSVAELIEKYPYVEDTKSIPVATRVRSGAGRNLLLDSNNFETWLKYQGVIAKYTHGIIVKEWGATDATEIETSGGTGLTKFYQTVGIAKKGVVYSKSVYAKNTGDKNVLMTFNGIPAGTTIIKPGEVVLVKGENAIGNGTKDNQIHIRAEKIEDNLKFILWHAKIEEGEVATPWIPFRHVDTNGIYFNAQDGGEIAELRSLPNGVFDEIRKNASGSYELVKRVGKYTLSSDTKYYNSSDNSNVFCIVFKKNSDCINLIKGNDGRVFIPTMIQYPGATVSTLPADTPLINNYFTTHENDSSFYFVFAKGTTVEGAKSKLAGTTIYYQLAEPKIIPLQASGTIHSMPSGTVYLEHSVADAGVYMDNISVLYKDLPILKLEKLSKLDFNTGMETELDVTKAVVKADKLSFTHPELVTGDIVSFIYEHNRQSASPDLIANFYDSRYVIEDSKNNKFYRWNIISTNGIPSIQLMEV